MPLFYLSSSVQSARHWADRLGSISAGDLLLAQGLMTAGALLPWSRQIIFLVAESRPSYLTAAQLAHATSLLSCFSAKSSTSAYRERESPINRPVKPEKDVTRQRDLSRCG